MKRDSYGNKLVNIFNNFILKFIDIYLLLILQRNAQQQTFYCLYIDITVHHSEALPSWFICQVLSVQVMSMHIMYMKMS